MSVHIRLYLDWKDGMEELVNQMKDFFAFKLMRPTYLDIPTPDSTKGNPPYRYSSAKWIYKRR